MKVKRLLAMVLAIMAVVAVVAVPASAQTNATCSKCGSSNIGYTGMKDTTSTATVDSCTYYSGKHVHTTVTYYRVYTCGVCGAKTEAYDHKVTTCVATGNTM